MNNITDPQQELFTALKIGHEALGYDVYDGFLPPEGTPYPFVYLGEAQQSDSASKGAVFGRVHQTIHFWHNNPKQRGTLSDMILNAKAVCSNIVHTAHYSWEARGISTRIFPDNTTKTPLLHGVLEVDFYFS